MYEIFIQAKWVPVITIKLAENLIHLQTEMYTSGSLLPPDVDYFPLVNSLKSKNFHSYQYFSIYYLQSIISHLLKRVIARTDALGISLSSEKEFWAFIAGYHKIFEVYNNGKKPMYSSYRGSFMKTFYYQGQQISNIVKPHEVPETMSKMEKYMRNEITHIFEILSLKLDLTNRVNVKGISDSFRHLTNIEPTLAATIAPTPSNFSNFNQFSIGNGRNLSAGPSPFSHPQSSPFVIGTSAAPSSPSATTATSSINSSPIKEQEIREVDVDNFVLSRFPKIMAKLETVIAERLAKAHSVFVNWFREALTSFPDCLVIVEYFHENNSSNSFANYTDEVKACLHWSKPEILQQYPHIIINKWYECLYQHFQGIENDFTLDDFTNLVENCKVKRLALLKQINDNLEVQAALTIFSQKIENKVNSKAEKK
jgi:hypothetical protein